MPSTNSGTDWDKTQQHCKNIQIYLTLKLEKKSPNYKNKQKETDILLHLSVAGCRLAITSVNRLSKAFRSESAETGTKGGKR